MAESVHVLKVKAIWEDGGATRKARELKMEVSGLEKVFGNFQTKLLSVGGAWIAYRAITGAVRGTRDFIGSLINANAQLELFNTQLRTILHSGERTRRIMENLAEITITTPVQLQDLIQASIALESAGLNSQKYLRAIVDWSAITKENVAETAVNFAKVASGSQQTARILATRFIQASQWHKELEKTANAADALSQIVERRWGGIGIKMSQTFLGVISNIKDLFFFISAELGKPLFEAISKDIRALFEELQRLRKDGSLKVWAQDIVSVYNVVKVVLKNIKSAIDEVLTVVNALNDALKFILNWDYVMSLIRGPEVKPISADDILPSHVVDEVKARALEMLESNRQIAESEALNILKQIQDGVEAFQLGLKDAESLSFTQAIKQLRALDNVTYSLNTRLQIQRAILSIQKDQQKGLDREYEVIEATAKRMEWMRLEEERRLLLQKQRQFGQIAGIQGEKGGVGFGGVQGKFEPFTFISEQEKNFQAKLIGMRDFMANWQWDFRSLIIDTFYEFGDAFGQMAASVVSGMRNLEDAFKRFLRSVLQELIAFFAKLAALKFLGFLANLIPGFGKFLGLGIGQVTGGVQQSWLQQSFGSLKSAAVPAPSSFSPTIIFSGNVYGMDDFEQKVEVATKRIFKARV